MYPVAASTSAARADQRNECCPFLSDVTETQVTCVKSAKSKGGSSSGVSRGVCTISSTSNGLRQDWLACPFRALDVGMLEDAARRLFELDGDRRVQLIAAPSLANEAKRQLFRQALLGGEAGVAYFQGKLGGEISVRATERSPELNFDATMVELTLVDGVLRVDGAH